MVATDGNGEFRAQAKALAGLALGHEDAAAQRLAGHIQKRRCRLDDRYIGQRRVTRREGLKDGAGAIRQAGGRHGWTVSSVRRNR